MVLWQHYPVNFADMAKPDLLMFPTDPTSYTRLDISRLGTLIRYTYLEWSGISSGHRPNARTRLRRGLGSEAKGTYALLREAIQAYEEVARLHLGKYPKHLQRYHHL